MTGERPFQAPALGPLVAKILTGPVPVPSRTAPDAGIPPEVDAWMASVLVRDRQDRLAPAGAVADSLAVAVGQAGSEQVPSIGGEGAIRQRVAAGDLGSAASLAIRQVGPEILRYLHAVLRDPDLADDAFSGFCERVLSALPRFQWRCSVRTWAYALARRAAADVRRTEGRYRRRAEPLTESRVAAVAEHVRSVTWPLLRTTRRSALLQLSDELPVDDRMLLVLRVDRGLAWQDVARVFLKKEEPDDGEVHRESARLRKRFQMVRDRLRDRARATGLDLDSLDRD
jgi:RNA polymerase sigma-70 factor (ECF subfamily)